MKGIAFNCEDDHNLWNVCYQLLWFRPVVAWWLICTGDQSQFGLQFRRKYYSPKVIKAFLRHSQQRMPLWFRTNLSATSRNAENPIFVPLLPKIQTCPPGGKNLTKLESGFQILLGKLFMKITALTELVWVKKWLQRLINSVQISKTASLQLTYISVFRFKKGFQVLF